MRKLLIASSLLLAACGGPSDFELRGRFKSETDAQVKTFAVSEGVSADAIRDHAIGQTKSASNTMAVYYWRTGSRIPGNEMARQESFFAAQLLPYDAQYDRPEFIAVQGPKGEMVFADCRPPQPDEICDVK